MSPVFVDDFRCQGRGCTACDGTGQIEIPERLLDDARYEMRAALDATVAFE